MVLNLADIKGAATEAIANHTKVQNEKRQQQGRGQENSKPKSDEEPLRFYGAPNLNHLIGTARRFIFRTGMPLATVEYKSDTSHRLNWSPTWTDKHIRVWAMSITPSGTNGDTARKSPGSPRKRTFDAISNDHDQSEDEYDAMRRNVVSKMFGSSWRYDALVPMQLSQVKMPATLYVRDPATKQTIPYTGPMPGEMNGQPVPDTTVLVREPWPGALTEFLPPTKPSQDAVSYIIRNHPQRGKFMPEKAQELNVYPQSKWNDLSNGHNVESLDGKTITPDMVLQPGKDGGGFAVVDLPTMEHVNPLVKRQEWREEQVMRGVGAIIWILGPGVSANHDLLAFQQEMSHLEHVVASPECCANIISIDSAARSVMRYNKVDANAFPMLQYSTKPQAPLAGNTMSATPNDEQKQTHVTIAQRGMKIALEPSVAVEHNVIQPPMDVEAIEKIIQEEIEPLLNKPKLNVDCSTEEASKWAETVPYANAEIITLGTGSSHPSTHRNVASILVRVPGDGSYLLDAGEGTLGTLQRLFAPEELSEVFKDLKVIWISHMHADHHLGLTSVIKAWYLAVHNGVPAPTPVGQNAKAATEADRALAVISDAPMLHWLAEFSSVEDFGYSRLIPLATKPNKYAGQDQPRVGTTLHLSYGTHQSNPTSEPAISNSSILPKLALQSLETTFVYHCRGAQAISLTTQSGFKFSYSGDCRPSADLAAIGQGSHVLIHEATFEDEMRNEAYAKKHSTADEALVVATMMKANLCLLTHFSQRYPTMPSWGKPQKPVSRPASPTVTPAASATAAGPMDIDDVQPSIEHPATPTTTSQRPNSGQPRGVSPEYRALVRSSNIRAEVAKNGMRVLTAFDYMRFKMSDVPRLEARQPLLKEVCDQLAYKDADSAESVSGDDRKEPSAAQKAVLEKKAKKKAKQDKAKENQVKNQGRKKDNEGRFKKVAEGIVNGSPQKVPAVAESGN